MGQRESWRNVLDHAAENRQQKQPGNRVIEQRNHRHVRDVPPQSHHLPGGVEGDENRTDDKGFYGKLRSCRQCHSVRAV